jgi:TIR domain
MADLFVSYSREDKARAEEIVRLLEDYGWDVFWDQETRAGTLWPKVLEEELNKARCLVALWTTTSIASRWVRIEAYEALQNDKLVPVLLDKVRPPLEFRQTQTFDLIGWNGDRQDARLAHLLADLTALAKAPGSHGGTSRPIKLVVPPTLQREKPATPNTARSVPDAQRATMDSPPPGGRHAASSSQGALSTIASSRGVMLGLGLIAALGAVAWLISVVDFSPEPSEPPKSIATTPSAPPTTVAAPAPAEPQPAKTTTVVAGPLPAPQVPKAATKQPPQKLRSPRCLAIEEKFQQTGQITVTDRDFLRSKECQS